MLRGLAPHVNIIPAIPAITVCWNHPRLIENPRYLFACEIPTCPRGQRTGIAVSVHERLANFSWSTWGWLGLVVRHGTFQQRAELDRFVRHCFVTEGDLVDIFHKLGVSIRRHHSYLGIWTDAQQAGEAETSKPVCSNSGRQRSPRHAVEES